MRYKFIEAGNKVICISTFAKKPIKGIAKCAPSDTFDIEVGKKLAQLRCDEKVADHRASRAAQKYIEAAQIMFDAIEYYHDMKAYFLESEMRYEEAINNRISYESSLTK